MTPINHPNFLKNNNILILLLIIIIKLLFNLDLYMKKKTIAILHMKIVVIINLKICLKKENWFNINLKLENNIKETNKMYERKVKDMENNINNLYK